VKVWLPFGARAALAGVGPLNSATQEPQEGVGLAGAIAAKLVVPVSVTCRLTVTVSPTEAVEAELESVPESAAFWKTIDPELAAPLATGEPELMSVPAAEDWKVTPVAAVDGV
jgi:hypothetical protein